MNTMRISILCIAGVLVAIQLRQNKQEFGVYISVAISIIVFSCILQRLSTFKQLFDTMNQYIKLNSVYLNTILKMVGITYIAEFTSGICKDTGYHSIASQIEIFAKLSILALSMPVMLALLQTIQGFLL